MFFFTEDRERALVLLDPFFSRSENLKRWRRVLTRGSVPAVVVKPEFRCLECVIEIGERASRKNSGCVNACTSNIGPANFPIFNVAAPSFTSRPSGA